MIEIPVFYTDKMVADSRSVSPSAVKPKQVVDSWRQLQVPIRIFEPAPVTVEQLCRVHDPFFVRDILDLRIENGFGNRSPEVAASLLYTNGAMLAAAREAIFSNMAAVAPCSGFHHAGYLQAEGFCTFNGLMVSAVALHDDGLVDRVGILDFDMHYGNGTDDIINQADIGYVAHYTAGRDYYDPSQADEFLARVPDIIGTMQDCDVILYQAGADPHISDPFGGWLTDEQLQERDTLVFRTCRDLGIPVAWNLAGGYQSPLRKVLDIHDRTLKAHWDCWRVHDKEEG